MSLLRFVPSLWQSDRRIYLATPIVDGKPHENYSASLPNAALALAREGIAADLAFESFNPHVDDSRNALVRHFLHFTPCSDLVFIDADVGFDPEALVRLVTVDRDIVAGIYPKKQDREAYPVQLQLGDEPNRRLIADADGLLEAARVPTGFLRIKRGVLERLASEALQFEGPEHRPGDPLYPLLFERTLDGKRWSGDVTFCNKARAAGFSIFVDPEMRFTHAGAKTWAGSLGDHLRRRAAT